MYLFLTNATQKRKIQTVPELDISTSQGCDTIKAMILAAGLGTRLRPLTNSVSKPMVEMANRPCMEHAVRLLAKYGVKDIVVNLHYMPEIIQEHFGDGSAFGVNITYSYEKELMGTAGGFKRVQKFFGDEPALIISGDALTDVNLEQLYKFHKENEAIATLALKQVADPTQYGVVVREGNKIVQFQEKPKLEEAISNLANTGIYLFDPRIFDHIPADTFYDFGKQVFPELLEKGEKMCGYVMKEYWCDVGDLTMYREAHYDMLTGVVRVELPGKELPGNIWFGDRVSVHPDVKIVGPVLLGNNCTIKEGARIYGPVVLGDNTVVEKDAVIKRSILWDNVLVQNNADLADTIVASQCLLPENIMLKEEVLEPSILQHVCEVAATKEK
ncbi:sugar phosphate nucleotidyltransferase [Dethiobacter alkaliphilus]|uniref:Nucleotidyl transferase n=1 Tax=Dethiobacter alkaliphilus AHT 1 TaxID=555088 RepID=C0GGS0_DETAL|nr:NDP-sugar synthase [Dethiobacter alkaliphilus]EEG77511.1 Nucleotidyl transferase [Dethiobacter alkaliphilus AHT 1]